MSADFCNFFLRYNRNGTGGSVRSWHKVRVSLAQIAYSPFAAQFSSRVSNTICYDLTSAAGERGGKAGGRKSLIYTVNGVIRTRWGPYLVYQPVGIMSF